MDNTRLITWFTTPMSPFVSDREREFFIHKITLSVPFLFTVRCSGWHHSPSLFYFLFSCVSNYVLPPNPNPYLLEYVVKFIDPHEETRSPSICPNFLLLTILYLLNSKSVSLVVRVPQVSTPFHSFLQYLLPFSVLTFHSVPCLGFSRKSTVILRN